MEFLYRRAVVGFEMFDKSLKCLLINSILDGDQLVFDYFSKTFLFTTLGYTWVAFALGSLAWWGPIFLQKAYILCCGQNDEHTKAKYEKQNNNPISILIESLFVLVLIFTLVLLLVLLDSLA